MLANALENSKSVLRTIKALAACIATAAAAALDKNAAKKMASFERGVAEFRYRISVPKIARVSEGGGVVHSALLGDVERR
jgi:6-phosphogluconate dehydrogenase